MIFSNNVIGSILLAVCFSIMGCYDHSKNNQSSEVKPESTSRHSYQGSHVRLNQKGDRFELEVNGKPFQIKGIGGYTDLVIAHKLGANAVRTWDIYDAQRILDQADSLGMFVMLGLQTGSKYWGGRSFKYDNQKAVDTELEKLAQVINRYKDHPALLMWNVGNEITLQDDQREDLAWGVINQVSQLAHRLDPHHPTTYSHNGLGRLDKIARICTDLDAISVNVFGVLGKMETKQEGLKANGWDRAYIITEWSTPGSWESPKTMWNAPIEMNTTERGNFLEKIYREQIQPNSRFCLGSFVFYWGEKFEGTHTFFSLLPEGKMSNMTEALSRIWQGEISKNKAPIIASFQIEGFPDYQKTVLTNGQLYTAIAKIKDPDGDPIRYKWEIRREPPDKDIPGEYFSPHILPDTTARLSFEAPNTLGGYRLYCYAYDGQGNIATVNQPFYVSLK